MQRAMRVPDREPDGPDGVAPSHVIRKWSQKFIDFSCNAAKLRQHKFSIEPNVFALVDIGDARLWSLTN